MFTIFLALAMKSLISFFDWCYERFNQAFNKEYSKKNEKEKLEIRLKQGDIKMDSLKNSQKENDRILNDLSAKIDMLIDSDKDDIKSYITR